MTTLDIKIAEYHVREEGFNHYALYVEYSDGKKGNKGHWGMGYACSSPRDLAFRILSCVYLDGLKNPHFHIKLWEGDRPIKPKSYTLEWYTCRPHPRLVTELTDLLQDKKVHKRAKKFGKGWRNVKIIYRGEIKTR